MLKILLIGASILVIIIVVIFISTKEQNKYVIGKEIAAADKKEEERLKSNTFANSPLRQQNYSDFDSGITLQSPKEVDLDNQIVQLTKRYIESNKQERGEVRNSLSQDDIYTIFNFCKRATVFGLRKQNENIRLVLS